MSGATKRRAPKRAGSRPAEGVGPEGDPRAGRRPGLNDFAFKIATANGTGSASANGRSSAASPIKAASCSVDSISATIKLPSPATPDL